MWTASNLQGEQSWSALMRVLEEKKRTVLRIAQEAPNGCDAMGKYFNAQYFDARFRSDPAKWKKRGKALTSFWTDDDQKAECPVHARCDAECGLV